MSRIKNTADFIVKANLLHNNKYDYSQSVYIDRLTKIKIICPEHGEFFHSPAIHLHRGCGCSKCGRDKTLLAVKARQISQEEFIQRCNLVHNNKYDYSKVTYDGDKQKITIICPIHGEFIQKANKHLRAKTGCPQCANKLFNKPYTHEEFIEKVTKIHSGKYDYSKTIYVQAKKKVIITCPDHGDFEQLASSHLFDGQGCPRCLSSKGERSIEYFLLENNIPYISQFQVEELGRSKFDFYLPDRNLCIEYDGEQHFILNRRIKDIDKAQSALLRQQRNDAIKNEYCKKNNINLLRISYLQNIEDELKNELFKH